MARSPRGLPPSRQQSSSRDDCAPLSIRRSAAVVSGLRRSVIFVTCDRASLRDTAADLVEDLGSDADDVGASSTAVSVSPSDRIRSAVAQRWWQREL
jgi:hypothetical protein